MSAVDTVQPKPKPDAQEPDLGKASERNGGAKDLSSTIWESMKSATVAKVSEPVTTALFFHNAFQEAKLTAPTTRVENVGSDHQQESGTNSDATRTQKNADGGRTDTVTGPNGSTEASTYDKSGKLVAKRTDNPDGTYLDWKVDARGRATTQEKTADGAVRNRTDYANGDFKEETKYKDGKKSFTSHFANSHGGYTDDKINRDGSQSLSDTDGSGKILLKYDKRSDGSYTQRKLNNDGSVVFHEEKPDGSYTESKTDRTGTSRTVHTVNKADGSSETRNFDPSGRLASERKTGRDKSFKETTYNSDDTKTIHEEDSKGRYSEQYLNSKGERVSPTIAVIKASPEFVQRVKDEIAKMPEPIRKLVAQNNGAIVITDKMSDVDPSAAKRRPRGYEKGETGNDSSGNERSMVGPKGERLEIAVIAQNTRSGPSTDVEGTVRHEVGHMVDSLLRDYSHGPAFKSAYDQDVAGMNKVTKKDEKYFLQKGHNGKDGREEAFAEAVRAVTGDPTEARNAEILALFPKISALVKKRLSEIPR